MASIASTSLSREGRTITGCSLVMDGVSSLPAASFGNHIGVQPDAAGRIDFPVDALNLELEAGKSIEAGFEHFEIVDHGTCPFGETLARHDRGDTGRIHHERGGGNAAGDGVRGRKPNSLQTRERPV